MLQRSQSDPETSLRIAAEIHKQVRRDLRTHRVICAGTKLIEIAEFIEKTTRRYTSELIEKTPILTTINGGIGFPVGLSINSCAAHYHPHSSDRTSLSPSDIVKIDFGTEVNGWIIDSAFTQYGFGDVAPTDAAADEYDNLTACMRDATNTGIKNIGIDATILEWSQSVEEVIRSYDGVYPITNLGGHNILHEIIHGNKFLPASASSVRDASERFCAGVYAIETFGSTNANTATNCEVKEQGDSTIFRLNPGFMKYSSAQLASQFHSPIFKIHSVQKLLSQIKTRFKTLPFAERYLQSSDRTPLALLAKHDVLYSYPPLCVDVGATAQYEHTLILRESGMGGPVVFSRDDDY
jgi:methionyl aminopeptidase